MLRVKDRRRHRRSDVVSPAVLRDEQGRIVFRGRSADVSPCGVKVVGPPPAAVSEGMDVWLEMRTPNPGSTGPQQRRVKLKGYVRRITSIGDWKSVIVIVVDSDVSPALLQPDA